MFFLIRGKAFLIATKAKDPCPLQEKNYEALEKNVAE